MPSMDTVVTSLGDVRPHTRRVAEEIASRWTLYFIWGIGPSGEHAEGRALDFMTYTLGGGVDKPGPVRVELGWEIARYLWEHRARLGVWYVIYRQQIISTNDNRYGPSGRWNPMPDRGDPTANHMDHPHVSLVNSPPAYRPPEPPEEDDMATPRETWTYRDLDYVNDSPSTKQHQLARTHQYSWQWIRERVNKPWEFSDETPMPRKWFPWAGYGQARRAKDASRAARDETIKNGQKLDVLLDAAAGLDADAIRQHIDDRHGELMEAQQANEAKLDQLGDQLAAAADERDELAELVKAAQSGELAADELITRLAERLRASSGDGEDGPDPTDEGD